MLIGIISYNSKTHRLAVFTHSEDGSERSFDIPDQELVSIYKSALVLFDINEMDDAVNIVIIAA